MFTPGQNVSDQLRRIRSTDWRDRVSVCISYERRLLSITLFGNCLKLVSGSRSRYSARD